MVGASFSWPCKITTAGSTVLARIRAASLRYIRGHLRAVYFSGSRRNIYLLITSYYISKLSVQFFLGGRGGVCAVDSCLWGCTGWIIHLQADEKRAGKVRSAEVEWPWFLLAAGHPAVAVVIIHTSQMAFPWASMKRTGQGLSCQVLPGPKNNSGPIRYLERERERESGLQEDFAELGDKNACSGGNTVVVVFPVSHILWPLITRTHAKKKEDLQGYHQSRPKRLFIWFWL